MQIQCYNFAKEPNSTKQPSGAGRSITCYLKDNCSLMHPVFDLTGFNLTDNYLKWGSRYYWIDDIEIISKDRAYYKCREDVLATYKSYIGTSSQYIVRSSHAASGSIIDGKYPATTSIIKTEQSLATLHGSISPQGSSGIYIVGIQNGESVASGGLTFYALTSAELKSLLDFMYQGSWLDQTEVNISIILQKELINPMQYISSITWYPFDSSMFSNYSSVTLKFGWWTAAGVTGKLIPPGSFVHTFSEQVSLPRHNEANSRGTYLNGSPFTRYTLFCYNFGQIPIDPKFFIEAATLIVNVTVDLSTGISKLTLYDGTPRLVLSIPGQFGAPVQISQLTQDFIGAALNVVSGSIGIAYGNFVGQAQGIISGLESIMPQSQISGANGSRMPYLKTPTILTEHQQIVAADNTHLGRPLCVQGAIQSYPGYVEVENADIDFACNYTELTEIKSFMESGFYYE